MGIHMTQILKTTLINFVNNNKMINLHFLTKRKHFFVLKYNINWIRVPLLRNLMLKIKITLLSKIIFMLNLCLLVLLFYLLLLPLSIHPLKILSLSNLLPILHPTKILMIFMQFPIVISRATF